MKQNRITLEQKEQVLTLLEAGYNKNSIASLLGINWKQVDYWSKKRARVAELAYARDLKSRDFGHTGSTPVSCTKTYAYLLGCYLGDGYVVSHGKYTWKLLVACDNRYPGIIEQVQQAIVTTLGNSVGTVHPKDSKSTNVFSYGKSIPMLFPQHGVGAKHNRPIVLEVWQQEIVKTHPVDFMRGLYHSDGSRYIHRQGYNEYVKFNFTNRSKNIIDLFCQACDDIGLKYTVNTRPFKNTRGEVNMGWTVTIGRKSDVEQCESLLGIKC